MRRGQRFTVALIQVEYGTALVEVLKRLLHLLRRAGIRPRRHGRQTRVYACWGIGTHSTAWVYQTYCRRFGIETRYRQLHEAPGQTHDHKNQRVTLKVPHHVYLVSNLSY